MLVFSTSQEFYKIFLCLHNFWVYLTVFQVPKNSILPIKMLIQWCQRHCSRGANRVGLKTLTTERMDHPKSDES